MKVYDVGDIIRLEGNVEPLNVIAYTYAIILGYVNPKENLGLASLDNMYLLEKEEKTISCYILNHVSCKLAVIKVSSTLLDKEELSNYVNNMLKSSLNSLNICTASILSLDYSNSEYVTKVPNFSNYLLKNRIYNDNNNNGINKDNLIKIIREKYISMTSETLTRIELVIPEKIESRRFYVYKSEKVFKLYYCLTESNENGTFIFYLLYNTKPNNVNIESDILKILRNSNRSSFLRENKVKSYRKMNLSNNLMEVKNIRIVKQSLNYNDGYNLRKTGWLCSNFSQDFAY